MKIDRHGHAKILSQLEIQLLFNQGLQTQSDRALFGICLYCCCRINEACTLNVNDFYSKGLANNKRGSTLWDWDTYQLCSQL